ncbi:MAG: type II toxin-antitoxin system RelB/DinJ family antitoxin [Oscillospiraceae bacterium]|jgi:DNA-damage-inducible protein J|nr:type II toxin-antitoxin system RelB/DinJ family antitoxin [Oscillospiraceae bacterium]
MASSTLSVRVDKGTKKEFEDFCSKVGLNPSTAINLFVRAVLKEKRIPFEISEVTDPFYSALNMAVLRQSTADADNGKLTEHELVEE